MKYSAIFLLLLLVLPAVAAKQIPLSSTGQKQFYNVTSSNKYFFRGLLGIFGVNVEQVEPARIYGPQREFGKPKPARPRQRLPEHYKPLGGIATSDHPGMSKSSCADFNCKPGQYVVADTSTKLYYRCYCETAKNITAANVKCLDNPKIAEKIGYHAGPC
jgi:hypothetical protein